MITVDGLVFEYPGKRVLEDVSFSLPGESITALVGPNGSGKTTLLRCLAALHSPLSGRITVDGIDIGEEPRLCHSRIGFLADDFGLHDDLTVRQCLTFAASIQGISSFRLRERVEQAAEWLQIEDRLNMRAGELSRGLRQRLAIAQTVIHHPKALLLDEPASGLDPEARQSLAELFLFLRGMGMTLLVSSHILAELEAYSTHMLTLRAGRMTGFEELGQLLSAGKRLSIRLAVPAQDLTALLQAEGEVSEVRGDARGATFLFAGDEEGRSQLLSRLVGQGLAVSDFTNERVDLQSAYLARIPERTGKGAF